MDLTTCVADFKLLSKQLQKHEKIVSIYDYFVFHDISYFVSVIIYIYIYIYI